VSTKLWKSPLVFLFDENGILFALFIGTVLRVLNFMFQMLGQAEKFPEEYLAQDIRCRVSGEA